jgi:superfamily II DNA or RNA helicase
MKKINSQYVGWDNKKRLFYIVFYAWYYNDTESRKKNVKYLIGKSGRTKHDVNVRSEQCAPKTGRKHDVVCLWGFKKDRWYLPNKIKTLKEAEFFANKVDMLFKTTIMQEYQYSKIKDDDKLGDEWYKIPASNWNDWLNQIQNAWKMCWELTLQAVDHIDSKENSKKEHQSYRGTAQKKHPILLNKFFSVLKNIIGYIIAPTGSGKTFMQWLALNKVSKFMEKLCNVVVDPKILPTIQTALNHAKISEGTKYDGKYKSVVVCSETNSDKKNELAYYGIDLVHAAGKRKKNKLDEYLIDCFSNKKRYTFYVNVSSFGVFLFKYLKYKTKFKINQKFGIIWDELHKYTGSVSSPFVTPIITINGKTIKPIDTDCGIGYTATAKCVRGDNEIGMQLSKYYGTRIQRIPLSETINGGMNSNLRFIFNEIYFGNKELVEVVDKNKKIEIEYDKSTSAPSNAYMGFGLKGTINLCDKKVSHIYVNTSRVGYAKNLYKQLKKSQIDGYIPKKYKIFLGLKKDGTKPFEQFSKEKFAIIISTRFSIESLDYPCIKGIVFTHEFKSVIDVSQTIGRGLRPFLDKDCYVSMPLIANNIKNSKYIQVVHSILTDKDIVEDITIDYTDLNDIDDIDDLLNVNPIDSGKAEIPVEIDKDDNAPANYRIHIDTLLNQIQSEEFGAILKNYGIVLRYTEEEILSSAQKKDKKGNYINNTPNKWRINDESIAFHAYNRTRFSEGKDDIWIRATAHMEHRATRSLSQFEQILKDAEPYVGKVWALKDFSSKYPNHINWIKHNPKSKEPINYNGKVIDMNMLPFSAGKMGHLTKEYIESQIIGCECMTDLARKLKYSNQATCRIKCDSLGIDYSSLEKTVSERATMANKRSNRVSERLSHLHQSINSIKKEVLNMELSDRTAVKEVMVSRTYNVLRNEGWVDKHFPKVVSNQFLNIVTK